MKNFTYHVPTKVVFGTDREREVGKLLREQGATKVLIIHGRQCAECMGLYERVTKSLDEAGLEYNDIGGVAPPPTRAKANEGIALGRIEHVDFILAIGGWSVIHMAKAVAIGIPNDGDIWEYYTGQRKANTALPVAVVTTTVAGAGEMSAAAQLTNRSERKTRAIYAAASRPQLAIINPMLTYTLPMDELQGGVAGIMMLSMAYYFTHDTTMELTDNICEVLMRVLIRNSQLILQEPNNYEARANVMWASALAHNDLTGCGNGHGDFTVYEMERELVTLYGVAAEGMGMAAIWTAWAHHVYKTNVYRFYRYGRTVWSLPRDFGTPEEIAREAIRLTEQFFHRIGMLGQAAQNRFEDQEFNLDELADRTMDGESQIGSFKVLTREEVKDIFTDAIALLRGEQ